MQVLTGYSDLAIFYCILLLGEEILDLNFWVLYQLVIFLSNQGPLSLSQMYLIARISALKWHNYRMFWSPIIVLSKQIIGDQNIR